MTIEQITLAVAVVIVIAVGVLVLFAVRQSRQSRHIRSHCAEVQEAAAQLGTRIDTVSAQCDAEFSGIKCRLSRLEIGT